MVNAEIMHIGIEADGRISLWDEPHPEHNTRSVKVIRLGEGEIALVPPVLSNKDIEIIGQTTVYE